MVLEVVPKPDVPLFQYVNLLFLIVLFCVHLSDAAVGWSRSHMTLSLPYICEIPQAEAYRIVQDNRDFGRLLWLITLAPTQDDGDVF